MPGPSEEMHPNLRTFLGEMPLYFDLEQKIKPDSALTIELTYVELLSYQFGNVDFYYPNDYSLIQSSNLELQYFEFTLNSQRTINNIQSLSSHTIIQSSNDGNTANLICQTANALANENYQVRYSLSLDELGLFSLSTQIPDSLLPDSYGGFFLFVAEPDPEETTDIMDKIFTLIIDRSGSMWGDKIVQARDAASFIVQNLNAGDKFNIVDFSDNITSFRNQHVDFNNANKQAALSYISNIDADGLTNISGAFDLAIPQFSIANDTTANIIIFFTDGEQTAGILDTDELASHVHNLVLQAETNISIFTFGIGSYVNEQLLTLLATQNNGLAEFLGDDQLESRITEFYLQIRNPVLLNTEISFSSTAITELYPSPLPNLYKGQQMIATGRYQSAAPVTVTLSGTAFGNPVSYMYELALADSAIEKNQFLTKIWAKHKIEHLLIQYYLLDPKSEQAEMLKQMIIELSVNYGVICPLTSFDPDPTGIEISERSTTENLAPSSFELLNNYPNPFNATTKILFKVNVNLNQIVKIRIYNSLGQLVTLLAIRVAGPGTYEVEWNGTGFDNTILPTGLYFYVIDFGESLLCGKMHLIK